MPLTNTVETSHLDRIADEVRSAATEVGAMIVPVFPRREDGQVLMAFVPASTIVGMIAHLRPRLVYLEEEPFDAAEDTLSALSEDDEDRTLLEQPRVKSFVKALRQYDGQVSRVVIGVVHEGVTHCVIADAPWFEKFSTDVQVLEDDAETAREMRAELGERKERKRIKSKVDQLVADPRFSAPKSSRQKKEHLARVLFPDLPDRDIFNIVTEAESTVWLADAGSR